MYVVFWALFAWISFSVYADTDIDKPQQGESIQHLDQNDAHEVSSTMTASTVNEPSLGQTVYEKNCIVCHQDGVAGAPKFRDESDWKPRLSGKSIDLLLASALKGLNAMPVKGTCQECSDADIKAAIEYMVPQ